MVPLSSIIFLIIACIISKLKINISPPYKIKYKKTPLYVLTALFIGVIIFKFGINTNLNLLQLSSDLIYDQRETYHNTSNKYLDYILTWLYKVLIPLIFILSISNKSRIISILSMLGILTLFLTTAMKGILFSILILIFFVLYKKSFIQQSLSINIYLILLIWISYFIDKTTNIYIMTSLFARRTFLTPALVKSKYFEFFENNHMYLGNSVFRSFVDNPYETNTAKVIGETYLGVGWANTGFLGDAFMNFGLPGIIIYSIITSLIILYFSKLNPLPITAGIFVLFVFTLNDGSLFTQMLTGGGFLLIPLSYIFLYTPQINIEKSLNK
tara:strand:- start:2532 stop:3512 length:981 start_codon:yes stop_codon:yes gene_type:complete